MNQSVAVNPTDIRRAAIDLLAWREHSLKELRAKLSRRFDAPELVEQQLDALVVDELQSDYRFCENFVRSKCAQGQGPQRISQQLQQRGIEDALIQALLWHADIDWQQLLHQLYRRRYGDSAVADQKERAKRVRFLQYRGFSFELIRELLL